MKYSLENCKYSENANGIFCSIVVGYTKKEVEKTIFREEKTLYIQINILLQRIFMRDVKII